MKKIIRKVKGKKVLSFVLAAIMLATTFNIALPMLKLDANAADIKIGDVSQTQIVTDTSVYGAYAANYLNGAAHSTGIVLPGLKATYTDKTKNLQDPGDYVIQGMSYYPAKDWFLVTAYHNDADETSTDPAGTSKIFALDAATGKFVAMFDFKNSTSSTQADNFDHGGGIAVSEHNLYYACGDKDRKIAYAPLSEFDVPEGTYKTVTLRDYIEIHELGASYTAYVCYDQGVLWTGNFYDAGADILGIGSIAAEYNTKANTTYNSMVYGYKLAGNSSEEEWAYLKGNFQNLITKTADGGQNNSFSTTANEVVTGTGSYTWNAYKTGDVFNIYGDISVNKSNGNEYLTEVTGNFGSFNLIEGYNYTVEFTSTNNLTDLYMFAPNGNYCNVKAAGKIEKLPDGRYHYRMDFTAGLRPAGAESSWPTTQSNDGSYTGTYTIRFDQDSITEANREFEITNIKISQTNTYENAQEKVYDAGSAGSPTYALALNNSLKDVQYAVVDNGKLFLSRSYGSGAGNSIDFGFGETSFLTIADIDLSVPGTKTLTVNTTASDVNNGSPKTLNIFEINDFENYPMMPMSEGLCVVGGDIFITFEGASNKYLNESGKGTVFPNGNTGITNCDKPVDVIWQLDPYALMEMENPEPEKSIYYEKVSSMAEIENGEEYLIVHKSEEVDSVTQKDVLYALNSKGGLKEYNLSKGSTDVQYGYNAMVGHKITEYSIVRAGETDFLGNRVTKDRIYLDNPEKDDVNNARWTIESIEGNRYKFKSTDTYFANCNSLYFDNVRIGMAPANASRLSEISIQESGNGNGGFWISNSDAYFLWCNDGLSENYNKKITSYYIQNGKNTAAYSGVDEQDGTFHCDALNTTNIIGQKIKDDNDRVFYIYKRVKDDEASTYESRVYTDLNAKLEADGTYTIDLETYAISPNHYVYEGKKPTDYIIVADTSESMANTNSTGIVSYLNGNELKVSSLSIDANTSDDNGKGVTGYGFSNPGEDIYFLHTDNKYYKIKLAVNTAWYRETVDKDSFPYFEYIGIKQRYWAYYIADDGLYYVLQTSGICGGVDGGVFPGITHEEFYNHVDNTRDLGDASQYSNYSTDTGNTNRRKTVVFKGPHYRFDDTTSGNSDAHDRISTLKFAASHLVGQIKAENSDNRIALVQVGASTGFYPSETSSINTGTDCSNAFWSASKASDLQNIINDFTTSKLTTNDGVEFKYVNDIMSASNKKYAGEDKERNVVVIFFSDGVAGNDDQNATETAANANIAKALTAKRAGAFIYTVMIGADGTTFNRNLYMEALSSKYAEASSMSENGKYLGGQSVDGVNYALSLASTTINNFAFFGNVLLKETSINDSVNLLNLNATSILREKLGDAFIVPTDKCGFEAYFVKGEFDAIGRFSFAEKLESPSSDYSNVVVDWDSKEPGLIKVSGYDYSKEYISKGKVGNKLLIRITGVLANHDADITNTSISNTATTAIYQSSSKMTTTGGEEFKKFPTQYFNIPEYTYVLDYGLDMLDTNVNGTLKSVSKDLSAQRDANGNIAYKSESENGLVKIQEGDQNLLYHTTPTNMDDSGYVLIQRDNGKYDWFEIKVVPASNVYFEEEDMKDKTYSADEIDWTPAGTKIKDYRNLTEEGDVVGFENAYDVPYDSSKESTAYSNGTAKTVTLTQSNRNAKTQTFDFVGTGIDIVSRCDYNTGILLVNIKNSDGKSVAASLVDTYCKEGPFNQTPVFSWSVYDDDKEGNDKGTTYGKYTVEVSALYLSTSGALNAKSKSINKSNLIDTGLEMKASESFDTDVLQAMLDEAGVEDVSAKDVDLVWFDDNSIFNGGTGVAPTKKGTRNTKAVTALVNYIDGFRVYNPLGTDPDAYTESNVSYANVIDNLAPVSTEGSAIDNLFGVAYITGLGENDKTVSFTRYQQEGPKGELYLNGKGTSDDGKAISFKINRGENEKVMLGLRAVNGTEATNISINDGTGDPISVDIKSATEMYYDITECIDSTGEVVITITNNHSTNILAINHIKFSGGSGSNGTVVTPRSFARSADATEATTNKFLPLTQEDLVAIEKSMSGEPIPAVVKNGVIVPIVEEEVEIPEDNTNTDNDNTNDDADTEESENEEFSLFSLIEMLIAFIEKILYNAFGAGSIA